MFLRMLAKIVYPSSNVSQFSIILENHHLPIITISELSLIYWSLKILTYLHRFPGKSYSSWQ